jgi:hypothetical protein
MRVERRRILVALLGLPILALLRVPVEAQSQAEPLPNDLRIVLRSVPRVAGTVPGEHSVTIDADGNAQLSTVSAPGGELPAMTAQIPTEGMEDIWSWIQKERFFELDPLYRDPEIQDGDFAEMTITANGETHKVRTVNIRVYAFDRIAIVIGYYLPEGRRIQYNALHASEYKAVER